MPDTIQTEIAYRLTSACCYQPDNQWREADLFSHLFKALETVSPPLVTTARAMESDYQHIDQQKLLVDYAVLFVGPGSLLAAPYGSVYLEKDRQVMGASTQAVLETYRAAGLQLADDFPELPDHIAVELEFCSYLLQRQQQSEAAGAMAEAAEWRERRASFLNQFPGRWVKQFCANLRENAETDFYRHLADLIEGLIAADLSALSATG
jgi:TorA maturation chaperone TorD